MNVYTVTVEHCNAEHEVTAEHGVACISKFYGEHPEYFNDDVTYLILKRVASGVRIRYTLSGRGSRHKVEVVGML